MEIFRSANRKKRQSNKKENVSMLGASVVPKNLLSSTREICLSCQLMAGHTKQFQCKVKDFKHCYATVIKALRVLYPLEGNDLGIRVLWHISSTTKKKKEETPMNKNNGGGSSNNGMLVELLSNDDNYCNDHVTVETAEDQKEMCRGNSLLRWLYPSPLLLKEKHQEEDHLQHEVQSLQAFGGEMAIRFIFTGLRGGKGGFGKQLAKKGRSYHSIKARNNRDARTQQQMQRQSRQNRHGKEGKVVSSAVPEFRFTKMKRAAEATIRQLRDGKEEQKSERKKEKRSERILLEEKTRIVAQRAKDQQSMARAVDNGIQLLLEEAKKELASSSQEQKEK